MASLEYFLVAESCSVDRLTNRVSLFHVMEEAQVTNLPTRIPQVVAASAWLKEEGEDERDFQLRLSIESPGTEAPEDFEANFQFGQKKRIRIQQTFQNLRVQETGEIKFSVYLNGKYQASHRLVIMNSAEAQK